MKVVIPEHSGFCPGVKNAQKVLFAEKFAKPEEPIYVYGSLIHNRGYIRILETKGIRTEGRIEDIPTGSRFVIRTHGVSREEEERMESRGDVIDLTCPTVKKLQHDLGRHADEGAYIIITGKKTHPEVKGLISYTGEYLVVESDDELISFFEEGQRLDGIIAKHTYLLVASQTTGDRALLERTRSRVSERLGGLIPVLSLDSTCPVAERREREALRLQNQVDVTFVVGDRESSNATRLFRRLQRSGGPTYFISDLDELMALDLDFSPFLSAQVVSSSSTPGETEEAISGFLIAQH